MAWKDGADNPAQSCQPSIPDQHLAIPLCLVSYTITALADIAVTQLRIGGKLSSSLVEQTLNLVLIHPRLLCRTRCKGYGLGATE